MSKDEEYQPPRDLDRKADANKVYKKRQLLEIQRGIETMRGFSSQWYFPIAPNWGLEYYTS